MSTYNTTAQDVQNKESRFGSNNADVAAMKSMMTDKTDKSKEVEDHRSNLPLPDQPPTQSDWQSADARTVNVGSGSHEGPVSGEHDSALHEPATAESSVRISGDEYHRETQPMSGVGRQGKDDLSGLPRDAIYR